LPLQVRISRSFGLRLDMCDSQQLQQMPASRAFKDIRSLTLDLKQADLKEGCWDALGGFLASSMQQWSGIQSVTLYGQEHMDMTNT
jgi:hypothetical protein